MLIKKPSLAAPASQVQRPRAELRPLTRAPVTPRRDEFSSGRGSALRARARSVIGVNAAPLGGSTSPVVEAARTLEGQALRDILPLRWAQAAPEGISEAGLAVCHKLDSSTPITASCANFVSAVLRSTGTLESQSPITSVPKLRLALEASGRFTSRELSRDVNGKAAVDWSTVPEGSVVVMRTQAFDANGKAIEGQLDPDGHVVIFTGMENGEPMFIGANSVDETGALIDGGAQTVNEIPLSAFQEWMGEPFDITAVYEPS